MTPPAFRAALAELGLTAPRLAELCGLAAAPMTPPEFRAALAELGLTAPRLAELCGRAAATGTDWAAGRRTLPAEVAAWVARRLEQQRADPPPRLAAYQPVPPQRSP